MLITLLWKHVDAVCLPDLCTVEWARMALMLVLEGESATARCLNVDERERGVLLEGTHDYHPGSKRPISVLLFRVQHACIQKGQVGLAKATLLRHLKRQGQHQDCWGALIHITPRFLGCQVSSST